MQCQVGSEGEGEVEVEQLNEWWTLQDNGEYSSGYRENEATVIPAASTLMKVCFLALPEAFPKSKVYFETATLMVK